MKKRIEHKMVNLGLPSGLKWADRNVGAESPEDFGDYFMWGSVTPDNDNECNWEHAPFNNGNKRFDEAYFNAHKSEWLDGDVLKTEYDAARAIMGGRWRMPTSDEIRELLDSTTQTLEELNGVNGILFTAPNGNSIFMPFAGYRAGSDVGDVGDFGYAWSSSLDAGYASYLLNLYLYDDGLAYVSHNVRYAGFVVRGVCQ